MYLHEIEWDWTDLAQDRHKWRAVVNTAMNLQVSQIQGMSLIAEELSFYQEGLYSMKLVS